MIYHKIDDIVKDAHEYIQGTYGYLETDGVWSGLAIYDIANRIKEDLRAND